MLVSPVLCVVHRMVLGSGNVPSGLAAGAAQATKLARAMVTKYGMSSVLGPTSIAYEDNGRSLSSETRAAVEQEVGPQPGFLLGFASRLSSRSSFAALPSSACSYSCTEQDA